MSNKTSKPESKYVKYATLYQTIWEKVDDGLGNQVPVATAFKVADEMKATIIHQDKYTIVLFEDGSKGIAKCMDGDSYNRRKGVKIAYNRAMIEHLTKETKKLAHDGN